MENTEYLQRLIEALEHVPPHLAQEFRIMRNLDQKVQDILYNIHLKTNAFINDLSNSGCGVSERREKINEIRTLFSRGKELAEDKVSRAENAYEMVDKQIQRLDADLFEFKKSLAAEDQQKDSQSRLMKKESTTSRKRKSGRPLSEIMETNTSLPSTAALALALTNNPEEINDMPVDPNEPTYCICNQVSFGEMVACDNPGCALEWFHFSCVGLTSNPKGKWYCPLCSPLMKNRQAVKAEHDYNMN